MGEPIRIYSPNGDAVTIYGKAQAAQMVADGYTYSPPVLPEAMPEIEVEQPAKRVVRKRGKRANGD
jgi:hypothetical protein